MSDHTLTQTGQVVTCDTCAYRACIAHDGRVFEFERGDATVDHVSSIAIDLEWRKALVEEQLRGLQQRCRERRPIFWELYRLAWQEGREISIIDLPGERDDGTLTARQFRKYGQHIRTEHGL